MKDRILKLCKRLKNCTLNDITQLMDIEPSVLEVILLFLINENKIQEKDGIYSVIEELPTIKVSYLTGVGDNCICDFYKIFRNLIYERQLNELVNHYCKNPQKFRFRKFFEKYAYFYNYNNKIFVTKKPLQSKRENQNSDNF